MYGKPDRKYIPTSRIDSLRGKKTSLSRGMFGGSTKRGIEEGIMESGQPKQKGGQKKCNMMSNYRPGGLARSNNLAIA